jgi:hypothetical protein
MEVEAEDDGVFGLIDSINMLRLEAAAMLGRTPAAKIHRRTIDSGIDECKR